MSHTLTWGYIVQKLEEKYGIRLDSDERFSFKEITLYIEDLYDEPKKEPEFESLQKNIIEWAR